MRTSTSGSTSPISGNTNPANLGDLTLDPSSADEDFEVTIKNGANAGAVDVKSINLSAASWSGYSLIKSGSKISGNLDAVADLEPDFVLVKDAGGSGGTADGFTIEGNVTGDVVIPDADGLTIDGNLAGVVTIGNAAGLTVGGTLSGILTAESVTDGDLVINTMSSISSASVYITDTVDDGDIEVAAPSGGSFDIEQLEGTSTIRLGPDTTINDDMACDVIIRSDMPSGTAIEVGGSVNGGKYAGDIVIKTSGGTYKDIGGDIYVNWLDEGGTIQAQDLTGTISADAAVLASKCEIL